MNEQQTRLAEVLERIRAACAEAGRPLDSVRLIGVSKRKSWAQVAEFISLGLRDFGENYVQEAVEKIEAQRRSNLTCSWHFIGNLQSNKAKFLPGRFTLFHALDSASLAAKLNNAAAAAAVVQECLLEVNLHSQSSKGGVPAAELAQLLESLNGHANLHVRGLMCIPDPSAPARPAFGQLRELQDKMNASGAYRAKLTELSMGMSHDFADAIREGATFVRVGTALFGERS